MSNSQFDKKDGDSDINRSARRKWQVPEKVENVSKILLTKYENTNNDGLLLIKKSLFPISKDSPGKPNSRNDDENENSGQSVSASDESAEIQSNEEDENSSDCDEIFSTYRSGIEYKKFDALGQFNLNVSKLTLPKDSFPKPLSSSSPIPDLSADENPVSEIELNNAKHKSPPLIKECINLRGLLESPDTSPLKSDFRPRTRFENSPMFQETPSIPLKKCIRVYSDDDESDNQFFLEKPLESPSKSNTSDEFEDIGFAKPCRYSAMEDGLADDDSWVEEMSHDGDEKSGVSVDEDEGENCMDSEAQDGEMRGFHRQSIDFTLHTIIEESCEESECESLYERKKFSQGATTINDLERYFFFGLSDEKNQNAYDASQLPDSENVSESSSEISEIIKSVDQDVPAKQERDAGQGLHQKFSSDAAPPTPEWKDSDGSVGSDSESIPSPEAQRRKKSVKARGMGRFYTSAVENNLTHNSPIQNQVPQENLPQENQSALSQSSDNQELQYEETSSETEIDVDGNLHYGSNSESPFDNFKRKRKKTKIANSQNQFSRLKEESARKCYVDDTSSRSSESKSFHQENEFKTSRGSDGGKYLPESKPKPASQGFDFNQLLRKKTVTNSVAEFDILKESKEKLIGAKFKTPVDKPSLTRKDSFNNWSSDEETNHMMSKMRQFFKSMVDSNLGQPQGSSGTFDEVSPALNSRFERSHRSKSAISERKKKSPQLIYFESELTRLMKTVPGIRDDQVREIVEYLSSEDTWSDSYDSSDYANSDLEGTYVPKEISQECRQIFDKLDNGYAASEVSPGQKPQLSRDALFVYQKLVQSFTKITTSDAIRSQNSPTLVAKVMHHIGSRLVALMHEVSDNKTLGGNVTPSRWPQHHKSIPSMFLQDDNTTVELTNKPQHLQVSKLSRSKSHDPLLLLSNQNNSGVNSFTSETEDRDVSDCERFSWRGSFESALMAADSRTKLSLHSSTTVAEVASTGNLLSNNKTFSKEQIDRVKSCGSIGVSANTPTYNDAIDDKLWSKKRRSSVPNNIIQDLPDNFKQNDGIDLVTGKKILRAMTLPRHVLTHTFSKQSGSNSLPRFHNFPMQQKHVKSARYRPPGFSRSIVPTTFERASSRISTGSLGLQLAESDKSLENHEISELVDKSLFPICFQKTDHSEEMEVPAPTLTSRNSVNYHYHQIHRASNIPDFSSLKRSGLVYPTQPQRISLKFDENEMEESMNFDNLSIKGEIEISLQYNYKDSTLEICVVQCRGLSPVDVKRNRADPYVKIYLLPDKSKSGKRKTRVMKHTLSPFFNEVLKFNINLDDLKTRTMWISVWHSDVFCRNNFLGQLIMPLENKIFDNPKTEWYPLSGKTECLERMSIHQGEIIVGLKYTPDSVEMEDKDFNNYTAKYGTPKSRYKMRGGTLYVLVKEARNLQTNCKVSGSYNAFCKSYLLPDKGRLSKQKTNVVKRSTGSPVWNHTFVYKDVSIEKLVHRCLELTVWSHDRISSNVFLGGIRLNLGTGKHCGQSVDWMDATDREISLWQGMLDRPNFWMEGCVTLRSNICEE